MAFSILWFNSTEAAITLSHLIGICSTTIQLSWWNYIGLSKSVPHNPLRPNFRSLKVFKANVCFRISSIWSPLVPFSHTLTFASSRPYITVDFENWLVAVIIRIDEVSLRIGTAIPVPKTSHQQLTVCAISPFQRIFRAIYRIFFVCEEAWVRSMPRRNVCKSVSVLVNFITQKSWEISGRRVCGAVCCFFICVNVYEREFRTTEVVTVH